MSNSKIKAGHCVGSCLWHTLAWLCLLATLLPAGTAHGQALALDAATPLRFRTYVGASATVSVPLSDGSLLVGGAFHSIGDVQTPYLARILPNGAVDEAFGVQLDGVVTAMAADSAGRILIGGSFQFVNGVSRRFLVRLAADLTVDTAFSAAIGTATTAQPQCLKIAPGGGILVGGAFSSFNGTLTGTRGIVKLQSSGALDTGFASPLTTGNVNAIDIDSSGKILIGGSFTGPANRIARLLPDGSVDSSFTVGAGPNQDVRTLAVLPAGGILVGGTFTSYDGGAAMRLLRLNADGSRNDTDHFPTSGTNLKVTVLPGGRVAVAGDFPTYNVAGNNLNQRGIIFLNGDGTYASNQPAVNWSLADITTPLVSGVCELADGGVLLSGNFDTVGTPSRGLLKLSAAGTPVVGWKMWNRATLHTFLPQADGSMYVGGTFTHVDEARRRGVIKLLADGTLNATFQSPLPGTVEVRALKLDATGGLLVAGNFIISGRRSLVRLNAASGALDTAFTLPVGTTFTPLPTGQAIEVLADGSILLGGVNLTAAGPPCHLVHLDASGAVLRSWTPATGPGAAVHALLKQSTGAVLVGGEFATWAGDAAKRYLVRLDTSLDLDTTFASGTGPGSVVRALAASAAGTYMGGSFLTYNGTPTASLVRLTATGALDTTFTPPAVNESVYALAVDELGNVTAGGALNAIGTETLPGLVRLEAEGTLDALAFVGQTWAGGTVHAVAARGTAITAGGSFTGMHGQTRLGLAHFVPPPGSPVITEHPAEQLVPMGGSATFSVTATGPPGLAYQWRKGAAILPGQTSATLPLTGITAEDAGLYRVVVSNSAGATTSAAAALLVSPAPSILEEPQDRSVTAGSTFTLSVNAGGTAPLGYQWYRGLSGETSVPVVGATAASHLFTAGSAGTERFWVRVSNAYGVADSRTITVTVFPPPVPPYIVTGLTNQTVNAGSSATFSVAAGGSGTLSYTWFKGAVQLAETSSSLFIATADPGHAGTYRVEVRSSSFSSGTYAQSSATLGVRTLPVFTVQPQPVTTTAGSTVTLTAAVAGPAPLSLQWQKNGEPVSGATATTLQLENVSAATAGSYRLRAVNSYGETFSDSVAVAVNSPPAITTPGSVTKLATGLGTTLTVAATGTAPLSYQWYRGSSGDTGTPVGANAASLDTGTLTASTSYWVAVTNPYGAAQSPTFAVVIGQPPTAAVLPAALTVNQGQTAQFSVQATGDAPLSYLWYRGVTPLAGETGPTLAFSPAVGSAGGAYRVRVSNDFGMVFSEPAELTVVVPPLITVEPVAQTVVLGGTVVFSVTATGTQPLTYQWFKNAEPLENSNSATLTLGDITQADAGDYSVSVTNDAGSDFSGEAPLTVNSPPIITLQPAGQSYVAVGAPVELEVTATGTGTPAYQWYQGVVPDVSQPVGGNSAQFISGNLAASTAYWVRITNAYGVAQSSTAVVTVGVPPGIVTQPSGAAVETGEAFTLEVAASGDGPFTYQWKRNGSVLTGRTTAQLVVNSASVSDGGSYVVKVTNLFGEALSMPAVVSVENPAPPFISQHPGSRTVAIGAAVTLQVQASGSHPLTYQWFKNAAPVAGATLNKLVLNPVFESDSGPYFCRVTNSLGTADSNVATLSAVAAPVIQALPHTTIATGQSTTLNAGVSGAGPLTYTWFRGPLGDESMPVGTNAPSLVTGSLTATTAFWLRVSSEAGVDEEEVIVTVIDPVMITQQPAGVTHEAGETASFSVSATGGGTLTYQWFHKGVAMVGETSPSLQVTASLVAEGAYTVRVGNEAGSALSAPAQLTVLSPPVIVMPLSGATLAAGSQFVLAVTAAGTPTLTYQWYLDDVEIAGQTGAVLSFPAVSVLHAGTYRVRVTNDYGMAESTASLIVEGAPVIRGIDHPATVSQGTAATLTADVAGPGPLSYFWFKGAAGDTSAPVGTNQRVLTTGALSASTLYWLRVTNPFGSADSQALSIQVVAPVPVITSASSAVGSVGSLFSYRILATNSPTVFGATPVPAGLTFDATTGLLSGVPTTEGGTTLMLTASNGTHTGTGSLNLFIHPPKPVHTGPDQWHSREGEPFVQALNIVHGTSAVDFANLPAWLSYDPLTQSLSGTPPAAGHFSFQILLTNAAGTTLQTITFTVEAPFGSPVITSPDLAAGRQGAALHHAFQAAPAATSFILEGELPVGVAWNPFTGVIAGVPEQAGEFAFAVRGQNVAGTGNAQTFVLQISPGPGRPVITSLAEGRAYMGEVFHFPLEATQAPTLFEAAALPLGLQVTQAGGGQWEITGQPLFPGAVTGRVRGVNAVGAGAWNDIRIDVRPGRVTPVISSGAVASARLTLPFSFALTATESPTGFAAAGLPDGLVLNEATGVISGTPLVAGEFIVAVTPHNLDGPGSTLDMTFHVGAAPGAPVIQTVPGIVGRQTEPMDVQIIATESPVRYTALTDLPPGLSLQAETGRLAGTPAVQGTFQFLVEAESAFGFTSAPTLLTVEILGPPGTPTVQGNLTLQGTLGVAFTHTVNSDLPYTWASIGPLPPGLYYDAASRSITGTPVLAGAFMVPVQLSNSSGAGTPKTLSFTILSGSSRPAITQLAALELGYAAPFTLQVQALNGPITTWRFQDLPPGLTYDALTGVISGRAARVGVFDASLSAANVNGFGAPQTVRFVVRGAATTPVVVSARSVSGFQDQEMAYVIRATNMPGERPLPSGHRFHASGLPSGFTLDPATGLIRGTPKKDSFNVTVWAENADGPGPSTKVTFEASHYSFDFKIASPGFASGSVGMPLTLRLKANKSVSKSQLDSEGGSPSDYFASVPSSTKTDAIKLQPVRSGSLHARAYGWHGDEWDYIETLIHILPGPQNPVVTSPGECYVVAGAAVNFPLVATQPAGGGPVYFTFPEGLPDGLYVSPDGHLSGRIQVPGTYRFPVAAANDFGAGMPKAISVYVAPVEAAPIINAINNATAQEFVAEEVGARGMMAAFASDADTSSISVTAVADTFVTFQIDAGEGVEEYRAENLPEGLVLNTASGTIAGVPTLPGQTTVRVSARSAAGWSAAGEVVFTITAAPGTPVITSAATVNAQAGQLFSHTLASAPAAASYNIAGPQSLITVDGALGTLSGTFSLPGTYVWTVSGNHALGRGEPQTLIVQVAAAAGTPAITSPGLISGTVGAPLTLQLSASGSPASWDVDGLPFGLAWDADTGGISGTPLEAGSFAFKVRAANAQGIGAETVLQFQIAPSSDAPVISSAATASVRAGEALSFQITASPAPDTFSVGALPAGLSLNPLTGVLSGVPATPGSYPFTVAATNAHGQGPSQAFVLTVLSPPPRFDQWSDALPPGLRGPLDDPYAVGIPNLTRYALGMAAGMGVGSLERSRLPVLELAAAGNDFIPSIIFTRSTEVSGISYALQGGADLGALGTVSATEEIIGQPAPGLERVRLRQTTPVTGQRRWFLRLRIDQTTP